jgi:SsrA-binding protein
MSASAKQHFKRIASNRRARHDYHVLERIEAGIALRGTEVKSVRAGQVSLVGAHVRIEEGQAFLMGMNIAAYEHGSHFNHDPERARQLLLHRREIRNLTVHDEQKGHALIPLSMYFKKGRVKVEVGICRGKRVADKRETLKRKTAEREAQRAIARDGR